MLQAQKCEVQGIVIDAYSGKGLQHANVCFIGKKDSILYHFQRTDKHGKFKLNVAPNHYFVEVSFPQAIGFTDSVNVTTQAMVQMDTIKIWNKLVSIREVLIQKYNNGIRIDGDTTEYLADFFKTNPGATVEDLLKKLPGIQVNKNGEIKAQGQQVKKILVDGEEFFPDDPSIATKYLRADMIEKVQVYEENKDTLNVSADDEKTKTLNLQLKQDQKRGSFGRVEAASDFEKYWSGGVFAGHFNQNLKMAGFAKTSNYQNAALGWQDRQQFGSAATGGTNTSYENGMMYTSYNNSFSDELDRRGIPNNTSIGLLFNNNLGKKVKLRSSYRLALEGLQGNISKNARYFLPDTSYTIDDSILNKTAQTGHRFNLSVTWNPDSLTTIDFSNSFGLTMGEIHSELISKTSTASLLNSNNRITETEFTKGNYNGVINYTRRFLKKGKSFSTTITIGYAPNTQDRKLTSGSKFYDENGQIKITQNLEQKSEQSTFNKNVNLSLNFTNPLSKYLTYTIYANASHKADENNTNTFNSDSLIVLEKVDSLSNLFELNQDKINSGFSLNWKKKKWSMYGGLGGNYLMMSRLNKVSSVNVKTPYLNLFPAMGFGYSWKKQRNVGLNYSGYANPPSINALQPLVNNMDPLNITVGNPDLVQSFNHNIRGSINSFQTLKGRYLWGFINLNIPRNAMVNSSWIDSSGRRRNMTVNTNGNYYFSTNFDVNQRMKKLPLYYDAGLQTSLSKNITFVNGQKVITQSQSYTMDIGFDAEGENIEFSLSYSFSYNRNISNLNNQNGNEYITQTPSLYLEAKLPKKFEIYTNCDLNMRPATDVFAKRNVYFIEAGVKKGFGKKNNFELNLHVNDLLNQNVGFQRNITTNLVSQELYTQLSRYWLLKARWNFAAAGGSK